MWFSRLALLLSPSRAVTCCFSCGWRLSRVFFYQMWLGSNVIKPVIVIRRGGHGVVSGLDRCS
jgi:hypothetical protein